MSRNTGCRHTLQLRQGNDLRCMSCGTPLNADTGRSLQPIRVQPEIGQRAASPISTSDTLRSLGYTEVSTPPRARFDRSMVTTFRRAGGKRNAYCPSYD